MRQDALIRAKMHSAGLLRSQATINADISRLSATDLPVCGATVLFAEFSALSFVIDLVGGVAWK